MCSPPQFSSVWPLGQRQDSRCFLQSSPCPQAWDNGKNWWTNLHKLDCQCCAMLPLGSPCLLPALVLPLLTAPLHWDLVGDYSVTTFDQSTPLHWAELCSLPRATLPQGMRRDRQWQDKAWSIQLAPAASLWKRGKQTGTLLGCTHLLLLSKPSVLWSSSLALSTKF